jgi:hypothetical protein
MASRSSTGVIVALVVFVVLSVSLLAVSIILYTDKSKAELSASEANAELNKFISADERGRTETQDMLGKTSDSSLFEYLTRQSQDVAEFVSGNRTADIVAMRTELSRSNKDFSDKETVNEAMRKLAQDRDSRKQGEELLKTKSNDLSKELDALKQRLAAAEAAHTEAVAKITASIATYQVAADGYRGEFDSAKASLDESRSEQKSRFESESASLQADIDSLRAERSVLDGRIGALQAKVESSSMKAANPAALVDSRVVDVDAKTGTIFIDIGSNRRVVPGMTFEVFDDSAGIVASASSGARGKASVQVVKVGETTSTCRVIRGSGSRPIVKDDVLANAVFNPDATFKFLVHGKFDVNGDGKSTTGESDYIKSRIVEWGGTVVEGDTLTGDLDFLVLGVQPPFPAPLPSDATEAQTLSYTDQRAARELYDQLFQTSADAQIPVLNWARFEALTGTVNR